MAGPVPSSSRKSMQPPPLDGPILPEDAALMEQANHEPAYDVPMDVDTTMNKEDGHVDEQGVREVEEAGVEEVDLVSDVSSHDEDELYQLEDKVALEEEELRKDHQGLDERPTVMEPHEAPTITALHEDWMDL